MENPVAVKTETPPKKKKALLETYDWTESILAAFLAVIVCLTFVVRGTVVDGDSMLPTLQNNQFLVLSRIYNNPEHGDIVVVFAPNMVSDNGRSYGKTLIKRVIGIPGDRISIDSDEGIVYRNGEPLDVTEINGVLYEDGYVIRQRTYTRHSMAPGAEMVVPENHLFIMGDNRNNSIDSRANEVSMVEMNYVVGKVILRLTPLEHFGTVI
jgi:signal peptidase I